MAVVNFYDDFLDTTSTAREVNGNISVLEAINKYLDSKPESNDKYECYNAETEETTFKSFNIDNYKTLITVNGKEETLDYIIRDDDVISVVFFPQSSDIGNAFANTDPLKLMLYIGVAWLASPFLGGFGAGIGLVAYVQWAYNANRSKYVDKDDLTSKNLLSVKGGSNTPLLNNKYPIIAGKHLIYPMIVGSPYHVTYTNDAISGQDNGQYYRALYCVGYGPLYLSNFKIGETILAYNTASTDGERQAILHGLLMLKKEWVEDNVSLNNRKYPEFIQKSQNDTFDILKKWKNNDVKLEILQFGNYKNEKEIIDEGLESGSDFVKYRHGIVYPQTVEEKNVDATVLFAYDKELEDTASILYKAVNVQNGYRTNSVRFSRSCPTRIQVELDMPAGYYATRTAEESETTLTQYNLPPLCVAVQWRFSNRNISPSDAESGSGWNTFDYMIFGNPQDINLDPVDVNERKKMFDTLLPITYTSSIRLEEISSNKGLTTGTKAAGYNNEWLGEKVFNLSGNYATTVSDEWRTLSSQEIEKYIETGVIWVDETRPYDVTFKYTQQAKITNNPVEGIINYFTEKTYKKTYHWYGISEEQEEYFKEETNCTIIDGITGISTNGHCLKTRYSAMQLESGWFDKKTYKANTGIDFNAKERRYVFEKTFTENECRKLSGYTGDNILDAVEVRVIRLTPCYLDEPSKTGDTTISNVTYQDLVKWTYLRTWSFDKEYYLKALKEDATNTSVNDCLSRPFSKEDSEKFTYIALELKQDLSETGGSSLEKLSCVAQSFAPNYLDNRENIGDTGLGKWYPAEINEVKKYYHKTKETTGWVINEVTASEYAEHAGDSSYTCQRVGTDYVPNLRASIMEGVNVIDDYALRVAGTPKYALTDKIATKYLSNNTASICLQMLFGAHLKGEAKTWDTVDKDAFTEAYRFYRDVTDGTKEDYKKDSSYNWVIDLIDENRKKTATWLAAAGWATKARVENSGFIYEPLQNGTYTVFSIAEYNEDKSAVLVGTPIAKKNDGTYLILTPEHMRKFFDSDGTSITETEGTSYDDIDVENQVLLARFTGNGAMERAVKYSEALHYIQDMVLVNPDDYSYFLSNFKNYPVNSVRSGCYDSQILDFMDYYNANTPGHLLYAIVYSVKILMFDLSFTTPYCRDYKSARKVFSTIKKLFSLLSITETGCSITGYDQYGVNTLSGLKNTATGDMYYKLSDEKETSESFETEKVKYEEGDILTANKKYIYFKNTANPNSLFELDIGTADELKGSGISHVYKDEIISALEQCKCFADSDNKLHISFTTNGVISKDVKLETLIQKIMLTGRSYINRNDYNKYEPLIGRPNPYPVTVLSQRNCYSKSNVRSFDETPSGFLVSFEDESDAYTSNKIYIMDDGEKWYDPTKKIEDFSIDYVTNRYQAASLARFNLASKIYQRESYTRTVGRLGINIALGDTILLQDDSLLVGTDLGGTIQRLIEDDNYIYGFIIDEVYNFTGNKQGVTILQPSKYGKSRCITLKLKQSEFTVTVNEKKERFEDVYEEDTTYTISKGLTNVVLFNTAVNKSADAIEDAEHQYVIVQPEIGNMVVFGEVNSISEKVVVTGIKPAKDNKFELTLVPYNEDLYNSGDEIPVFTPNTTIPEREPENYAFTDIPSKDVRATDKALILDQVSKSLKEFNSVMVMIYKKSTTELTETGITAKATYTFSTKSIVWDSAGTNNGWVTDYKDIEEDDGDLYISTASSFGSGDTDVIDTDDWSVPSVSGKNGINTATITIYKRSSTELKDADLPTAIMTYNYATKEKSWGTTGSSNGWGFVYPNNENNTPLYVSTATVASSTETDTVESGEWTTPTMLVKDGQDGGYQDYVFTRAPYGTSDEELRKYKWYDAPPSEDADTTPDDYDEVNNETKMCLYMATKWVSK